VKAIKRNQGGFVEASYSEIWQLSSFSKDKLINAIKKGFVAFDFDARTGHNHGTKIRIVSDQFSYLYDHEKEIK
jgi:hypothetical protein